MQEELAHTAQNDDLTGQVLAERFEILSLIGEGGMGMVYKARHILLNRIVAIKLIRSELIVDQTVLHRFQQEAQAISQLDHANIVEVYDFGVTPEGAPYLVMDYLKGISLSSLLSLEERLMVSRALPLFLQASHALKHAHEKGIIHRDFKASNLMICRNEAGAEVVKIVDFGMAKLVFRDSQRKSDLELTKSGEVFGSPLYMSPEQCRGQKLDARSDLYSLACVMYYALAGPPFLGENVLETLQKQIYDDAPPPSQFNTEISAELDRIILKALQKDPEQRYQDAGDMLLDLEALTNDPQGVSITQPIKKPVRGGLMGQIESHLGFALVIMVVMVTMTAFVSGRMFEANDTTADMNMWVDHNQDGDKARRRGDLVAAERYYKEAITEAMRFGKNDPRVAKSFVLLGTAYYQGKQYARADTTLKRAMEILERAYGKDCFEESAAMIALVKVYEAQGRQGDADDLRRRAELAMESAVGEEQSPLAVGAGKDGKADKPGAP